MLSPIWHSRLLTAVIVHHQRLGFESFTEEVEDVLKDHKQQQKVCAVMSLYFPSSSFVLISPYQDREKKVSKLEQSGKTEQELFEEQQRLFAESRAKYESQQQ
jgi:down-regulator of transcription 1